jgi:uncharacterized protein
MTARSVPSSPSALGRRPGWRRLAALSISLAAGLLVAAAAVAQDVLPVPPLAGRVIDQTATLTPAQAQALTTKLASIEQQRGSQLVILIVATTLPEDIAAYGQRVADTWKIGRRDVGDGVLVIVAKTDRRARIEVAKTLEGALPDVLAGRIVRDQMAPAFKADDYAGGLNAAVDRIDQAIGGEGLPAPRQGHSAARNHPGFDLQDMAIFLFVAVPLVGGVLSAVLGRKLGALVTGGLVGGIGWWITASLLVAGGAGLVALFLVGVMGLGGNRGGIGPVIWGGGMGGGGFGGGRGGGGGGGFSSGGGGDFGGGGASGSW